jgi:hypothetical protein
MVLKVLFGFLLGFILGVIGTGFLVTSGAGNYLIAANPRVQELEAKIREAEDQRTFVTRRLEEVARVTERMATRFEELQDRFAALERSRGAASAPPPAEEPSRAEVPGERESATP